MSDEPTYPKDAAVGSEAAAQPPAEQSAKPQGQVERSGGDRRKKYVATGVAVGIGSAAIVAALLYANRGKRDGGSERS